MNERDRQTDRQRHRETHRETERDRNRQRHKQTETQTETDVGGGRPTLKTSSLTYTTLHTSYISRRLAFAV